LSRASVRNDEPAGCDRRSALKKVERRRGTLAAFASMQAGVEGKLVTAATARTSQGHERIPATLPLSLDHCDSP
jgi:hypothetical protein